MTEALWSRSASELSRMLSGGEVSSVEVVRAHLQRIEALDAKLHAFTHVFHESALAEAARADAERARGHTCGPLHGLPVSVKECYDHAGLATTLGITSWKGRRASRDAAMVTLLKEAGAVILGRTNISQTMLFAESRNPLFGQSANPWSLAHSPGGSSGGEAAAIASGMSPLGIGTDIGGSIRTPCHFSGIAGIKPTLDRLTMRGVKSVLAGQEGVRSQGGPMARRVGDLVLLFEALDPKRMASLDPRVPPLAWEGPSGVDVSKLRLGVYWDDGVMRASKAIVRAIERASDVLRARGCEVVPFVPPGSADGVYDHIAAVSADGGAALREAIRGEEDPVLKPLTAMARVPPVARRAVATMLGLAGEARTSRLLAVIGDKSVGELWTLIDRLRALRFEVADAMRDARIDLLLCPAYATPAVPHGDAKNFTLASSFPILWNALQFPAGVVPVTRVRAAEAGRDGARDMVEKHAAKVDEKSAGLPVGVQVVGRPWDERTVLAAMLAIEHGVESDEGFPRTPVDPA